MTKIVANYEEALDCVQKDGLSLDCLSDDLRNNKNIVIAAILNHSSL